MARVVKSAVRVLEVFELFDRPQRLRPHARSAA